MMVVRCSSLYYFTSYKVVKHIQPGQSGWKFNLLLHLQDLHNMRTYYCLNCCCSIYLSIIYPLSGKMFSPVRGKYYIFFFWVSMTVILMILSLKFGYVGYATLVVFLFRLLYNLTVNNLHFHFQEKETWWSMSWKVSAI